MNADIHNKRTSPREIPILPWFETLLILLIKIEPLIFAWISRGLFCKLFSFLFVTISFTHSVGWAHFPLLIDWAPELLHEYRISPSMNIQWYSYKSTMNRVTPAIVDTHSTYIFTACLHSTVLFQRLEKEQKREEFISHLRKQVEEVSRVKVGFSLYLSIGRRNPGPKRPRPKSLRRERTLTDLKVIKPAVCVLVWIISRVRQAEIGERQRQHHEEWHEPPVLGI